MAQNDQKKAMVIKVSFTREQKTLYDEALRLAKGKTISDAAFGRLAINYYVQGIKSGKIIL